MNRLTVHYAVPDDPAAFDEQYANQHVPIALKLPGLQAYTYSKVAPVGGEQAIYMTAELDFADAEALNAAMNSPEMGAAVAHAQTLGVPMSIYTGEVNFTA